MLKRFCCQSYHQTGVTSCTVIIHPWCFTIFNAFHHGNCPSGPPGCNWRNCSQPMPWRITLHFVLTFWRKIALFHDKGGSNAGSQSDTKQPKSEQTNNDNWCPKKHVETGWIPPMYKYIDKWCTLSQHHTKDFPWVPLAEFWAAPLLQDPDTTLWLSLELPSTRFQGVESCWFQKYSGFEKSILKHCVSKAMFVSNYVDKTVLVF